MTVALKKLYAVLVFVYNHWDSIAALVADVRVARSADRLDAGVAVAQGFRSAAVDGGSDDSVPQTGLTFDAEVVRVIDGDTIEVETRLQHRIRLLDCWCEETRLGPKTDEAAKARGLEAKQYLAGVLLPQSGNRVRVNIPGHGGNLHELATLGRVLGDVWTLPAESAPVNISAEMVARGFATRTKGGDQ